MILIHFWWWLEHFFGVDNGSTPAYLFWSGIVGDLALFSVFTVMYKKLNCHAQGCLRIGLHHVKGTPYVTCRKHHPEISEGPVHVSEIHAAHKAALDK